MGIKERTTIKIYDALGNLMQEKEAESDTTIDTSLFPSGIYTFVTNGRNRITDKLVILK